MASRSFYRRPSMLLALGLCMVGGFVTLLGRLATGPQLEQKRVTLAAESGVKAYPSFSPDGKRVVYSAHEPIAQPANRVAVKAEPGKPVKMVAVASEAGYHLFIRSVPGGVPQQLTSGMASDIGPAWSPDGGSIAFVRLEGDHADCMVVPAAGGEPRKIAACAPGAGEPVPEISWAKDGKSLFVVQSGEKQLPAIFRVSLDGTAARVTRPENSSGDFDPAVSPDGNTLAFVRNSGGEGGDIFLSDVSGANPRRLTFDDRVIRGISWTPDGHDIVYSCDRMGVSRLWRIPIYGGSARELQTPDRRPQYPAVAPRGGQMVYSDSVSESVIWRSPLNPDTGADRALIRSAGHDAAPSYSPDGRKIADVSDQTGTDEVWVSDADGSNRVQITHFGGPQIRLPRWSPDGKTLLVDTNGDRGQEVFTVPVSRGTPKRVVAGADGASWSHDGKSIYYFSQNLIFKATATGANPHAITRMAFSSWPDESADGKYVYYRNRRSLWRVPSNGGTEEQLMTPERGPMLSNLQVTPKGVYFLQFLPMTRGLDLAFYDLSTRESTDVLHLNNATLSQGTFFSVSPDGKYVLYPRVDRSQTDLILVENFR